MSESDSGSGAGRREVAYRLFAREFDDSTVSHSESDEERAPNYVVSPTGGRVNRLFLVGVLTELERVNEDMLRARIVDPTGPFVVYAGQYQPDALSFLEAVEPPSFLAVTGKARTFQPEDSDVIYTSVRPESISEVDAQTRDRWVVETAEQTLDRVATMAAAKRTGLAGQQLRETLEAEGVDDGLASGIALALEHYGTTGEYLASIRETALDAARVVAGEREEIEQRSVVPDEGGDTDLDALAGAVSLGGETAAPAAEASPSEVSASATGESSGATTPTTQPDTGGPDAAEFDTTATETAEADTNEPGTAGSATTGTDTVEGDTVAPDDAHETSTGEAAEGAGEAAEGAGETAEGAGEEIGDFEPGEFDLDDSEREQIEEEFGTDFETGNEVDEPGQAGIEREAPGSEPPGDRVEEPNLDASDTQDAGPGDEEPGEVEPSRAETREDELGAEEAGEAEGEAEEVGTEESPEEEPSGEVDLDEAVMEMMADLGDGEGADREELVATVAEKYGVDPEEVEGAIEDALMSGRCYEPGEGKLSPI